jgi:tetratricopeptide (TPR) repeat protein
LGYLAQQKGDMGKAARYGEAILALNPANIEWMRNLAQIYYTRKSYQRAEKMARRVFNTTQTVQDSIYLANILAERKNYAEAIQHYTRIAEKAKDDELIYRASMGLGYAYQITGKQAAAHQSFSRAAHIKPGHEARAAMALTNSETNPFAPRTQHPPNLTELLASYKKYPTAHTAAAIGYAYAQKEEHEKAAYYLSAAVKKKNNPAWRLQLTQHYVALRQPTKALEALQPLLGEKVQAETQARALRQMGYIHAQAGDFPAAAAAFQSAIERGYADASTRRELGFIYAELKKYPEAIEQLLHVMAAQPAPKDLLGIGRIYAAMNEPGPALQYYKMAESQPQGLDKRELAALYGEMGFLFAQGEQFEHAHRAWSKAADLHNTPDLQLNLAYAEEMRGMQQDAFARIDAIQHDQLDRSQKLRLFAQYARLYKKDGDYDNTVRYLTQALMLEPSAERHYELALYAIKKEKYADARVHLEDAVRLAPQNQTYRLQLAYVCKHQSDSPCTIAAFEHVAGSNPERLALQQDLAYAYAQAGDNEKSIAWFKKAIDTGEKNLLAQASGMQGSSPSGELAQAEAVDAQQVYAMRQQIREMTRSYQFNAYQGYRSNTRQLSNIVSPSFTTGGVVPSQGGVEFLYQPPGIGYQDGRTFRLFGRALWSNRPGSLHIESNTVQGGLGVEYKPLRDENIYVGVERLIKIGSQSENNWLLRASWGYSNGYDLKPNQASWNQTIVYADVGYFIQHDNIRSVYAELRQGRTFNIDNRLLLTPHVTLAGRGQTPDPFDASYLEIGAGISLKYLFNETHYSAARSSGELTVQYRKATTGNHEGGWLATAALRF